MKSYWMKKQNSFHYEQQISICQRRTEDKKVAHSEGSISWVKIQHTEQYLPITSKKHKKPKPLSQKELTKLRKAKISAETMAIGNKVRDLVDRETQRALTPRELKKIRKARMNIKHEREVMMAVPVAEYMSANANRAKGTKHKLSKSLQNTAYQIQISEISSSLPHTTVLDNMRREQLIHFPSIKANPRDQILLR